MEEAEHLLHRPDMYCGSISPSEHTIHVFVPKPEGEGIVSNRREIQVASATDGKNIGSGPPATRFESLGQNFGVEWRTLVYPDAMINVVLEIVTNALDRQFRDETMRNLSVWFDCTDAGGPGWVRVRNDGQGVPVVKDEDSGFWKPYMAFGMFRTGSNFDDTTGPRYTGGRNGFGCKATNVLSSVFKLDTADPRAKLRFEQTFTNNMSSFSEPRVRSFKGKKGYTDVSFLLDFARLGLSAGLNEDARLAIASVIIDASACCRVKMMFNGTALGVRSIRDYAALFSEAARVTDPLNENGGHDVRAVGVCASKLNNGAYDCVRVGELTVFEVCGVPVMRQCVESGYGFVNSLRCSEGTHMTLAFARISDELVSYLQKTHKRPDLHIPPSAIRAALFIVVRVMVDSPEFSSQTKEKLTTSRTRFGFDWHPSPSFVKTLVNLGIADAIYQQSVAKEGRGASVLTSAPRRVGAVMVDKYEGATLVRDKAAVCRLLVTEGDSAKQLALAGLSVVGRETFGVFPLKGKLMNVRTASVAKLMANVEILALMKILGLEYGKTYTSMRELRYKKLVIFSDQDPDGAHIASLVLNFIHHLFPSVLKMDPTFVQRFATPIVRATLKRGGVVGSPRGSSNTDLKFYALRPYEEWTIRVGPQQVGKYAIKYYKGLGTSTSAQAREYFAAYDEHVISLTWEGGTSDTIMRHFFASTEQKGATGPFARKNLLTHHYDPLRYVDYSRETVSYSDFLCHEVLPFAAYANARALPSVIDGLKPSQRKVLHTFFARNVVSEVKVAQVASTVAMETAYHHGEVSLVETIVGMAQDHVGASNVNLLRPEGQFGTRHDPPGIHAAARYIFTGLDPIARALFPKADDAVLDYLVDEGETIEPVCFAPIVPYALMNGIVGIGYGWSTAVPAYNPADIIAAVRDWIRGGDNAVRDLVFVPWYAGHTGVIVRQSEGSHDVRGLAEAIESETGIESERTSNAEDSVSQSSSQDGVSPETKSKVRLVYANPSPAFVSWGVFEVVSEETIVISELPVGTWTNCYIRFIEDKLLVTDTVPSIKITGADSRRVVEKTKVARAARVSKVVQVEKARFVRLVEKLWTDANVRIVLRCDRELLAPWIPTLRSVLKLGDVIRETNMHLHDASGVLRKYDSPNAVVCAHAPFRLAMYEKRRVNTMRKLERDLGVLENKRRFVDAIVCRRLELHGMNDEEITTALQLDGFDKVDDAYDYLLNMPVRATTRAKLAQLDEDMALRRADLVRVQTTTSRALWLDDLLSLETELVCFRQRKATRYANVERVARNVGKAGEKGVVKETKKRQRTPTCNGTGTDTGPTSRVISGASVSGKRSKSDTRVVTQLVVK